MKVHQSVSWESAVFPCWERAAHPGPPNYDVSLEVPRDVAWCEATIEEADVPAVFLLASSDIMRSFGSYRLVDIDFDLSADYRDDLRGRRHQQMVLGITRAIRSGEKMERPILVADDVDGPFVVIEGNHRCIAYFYERRLAGLDVYLGRRAGLLDEYRWAWPARGFRRR